jgi:hypothetical protein
MEETAYIPKAYEDSAPIPVIFEYDGYHQEISKQVADKFEAIKTRLSPVWQQKKEDKLIITWEQSDAYNYKHLSLLFALADNQNISLQLDDIMPLHALSDELQASQDIQENITERSLTILNTTLASTIAREQKEKAIAIYNSMLATQDDDTIKQIAEQAEHERALHGVYEIMYSSSLFQKMLNNKKNHSLLQQWIMHDPAKKFFDMCMKHKRSVKTMLEENSIDPAYADPIKQDT